MTSPPTGTGLDQIRVLIFEDEIRVAWTMVQVLRKAGFRHIDVVAEVLALRQGSARCCVYDSETWHEREKEIIFNAYGLIFMDRALRKRDEMQTPGGTEIIGKLGGKMPVIATSVGGLFNNDMEAMGAIGSTTVKYDEGAFGKELPALLQKAGICCPPS